ncbi:WXG100 family type VII secretion target [Flindersiella endophytica]
MSGNLLHGITEDMQHLAARTRQIGDSIHTNTTTLGGQLDAGLRPGFMGAGGNAFFTGQTDWDTRTKTLIALAYQDQGDTVGRAGQQYDMTDLDVQSQQSGVQGFGSGSIAGAINPSA